ncbi:hypothetical protein P3X46_009861 [Hevea brasiliensis]|uniref:BZIP domain-containing protein n=1 Tax=Hevea brasiliensis TaxID=3981 RepID=A0ABQ9MCA1_HEVBR|nr:ABSCISIC ACID-INSENSITIVE 5-like protein 1 [Hevea brasiliensis]KAJ9177934.1 hypothetical protein P3X46_009861 [Hevea brasiliensis]
MVLSESDRIAYGSDGAKSDSPHPPQIQDQDSLKETSSFSPLAAAGQNSLLSLTLNEIQHKSGKSFGSMNMDEFLANLWSVDENQDSSQPNQHQPTKDNSNGTKNQHSLVRQGSFSIPAPFCNKTVDEVWFEIQKDRPQNQKPTNIGPHEPPQRQQTLGEMTLEDFLIKAGIVQEAPGSGSRSTSQQKMPTPPSIQNISSSLDASFGMGQVIGIGFSAHQAIGNNFSAANSFSPYQMFPQTKGYSMAEVPNSAKNEQGHFDLSAQQNKKRIIDGPPEVVVERRQRRMIKNRESAARSRARKQAYTVELELELNQLKEENAKLKQLVEEIEQNRKEEVMRRKPAIMPQKKGEKLRSIRRTVSLTW